MSLGAEASVPPRPGALPGSPLPVEVTLTLDGAVIGEPSNWHLDAARAVAAQADVALVFVSATSGENFITIDGNAGDRNNLVRPLRGLYLLLGRF